MYTFRLLDLAWPHVYRDTDMPDEPGKSWWPITWKLPPAFQGQMWMIAPPKKLEQGQHCLINEMDDLAECGGGIHEGTCRRRRKDAVNHSGKPAHGKAQASNDAEADPPPAAAEHAAANPFGKHNPFQEFNQKRA